jgi:branched-chain amino acid transport system permease protein
MAKPKQQQTRRADADQDVREMFDKMTRAYLLTVISDDLVEEHRRSPTGHHSDRCRRNMR